MLWSRRSLLLPLLRMHVGNFGISWRNEVWPFQWKIAVSWLCDYFIFQLFTPVIFAFRGPAEAGRMGLSMNIVMQMSGLMLVWMTTKAAPFGSLIAKSDNAGLDALFFRAFRQSLLLLSAASALVMGGVLVIPHIRPKARSSDCFLARLSASSVDGHRSHIVQSEAIYLRSHKCEPFLVQSISDCGCDGGRRHVLRKNIRDVRCRRRLFRRAWCLRNALSHNDLLLQAEIVGLRRVTLHCDCSWLVLEPMSDFPSFRIQRSSRNGAPFVHAGVWPEAAGTRFAITLRER